MLRMINSRLEANIRACVHIEDYLSKTKISHHCFHANYGPCVESSGSSVLACYNDIIDCRGGITVSCS